jgi:uncharacterized protein (TIGR00251 family)
VFYTIKDATVTLRLKAQPSASRTEFAGRYGDDAIKIRIKAPAVEGAANKELVKFLAKQFKIPKSTIAITSGETGKQKTVTFPLSEAFEEWRGELEIRN